LNQSDQDANVSRDVPVTVFVLSKTEIYKLVGFDFHRGVIACGERPTPGSPIDLGKLPNKPPVILAALGISDRENLGSMIRTASALGADHVLVDQRTIDPYARRVIRTSMATIFQQTVYVTDAAASDLGSLASDSGFRTVATTLQPNATPIEKFQIDHRPIILMMGNEADGLSKSLQGCATDRVTLPMSGGTDSLNVSIATAIFLYEINRLRKEPPSSSENYKALLPSR
jgi:tRNA G18 (ribose-2'-O)-methylase SpoU